MLTCKTKEIETPLATLTKHKSDNNRIHKDAPILKITGCDVMLDRNMISKNDSIYIQRGKIINPKDVFFHDKKTPDTIIDLSRLPNGQRYYRIFIRSSQIQLNTYG